MKALISPNEGPINYVSSWELNTESSSPKYLPIFAQYPNSCRVAQVEPDNQTFPVAEPLFWTDCPDDCVADQWWYDTVANTIQPIVNAPIPN